MNRHTRSGPAHESDHCEDCRRELARCLEGHPQTERLVELAIDRHVLTCSECRDLLEREHALELLLSSLPDPHLPSDLTTRLIARLRASLEATNARGADDLDRILDRMDEPLVPAGLAAGVLADVAFAREAPAGARAEGAPSGEDERLDRVLEELPQPVVPGDLSRRLLGALERDRRPVVPRLLTLQRVAAVAAVLLGIVGIWWLDSDSAVSRTDRAGTEFAGVGAPVNPGDEELLSYLDVLENWEFLVDDDLEVLLSSVDSVDELLLDVELVTLPVDAGNEASEDTPTEPSHG